MSQSPQPTTTGIASLVIMLLLMLCANRPARSDQKPVGCTDVTPHEQQFVTVAPGVNLEVLDWGGSGEAMVLLTGVGDNAHVFDQFAFQFTDSFHVIGITRRGFLPSSQPKDGYDIATRVADDIAVLDALGIDKAILVGHSVAGSELSAIGAQHKDRVDKLVYLEAYDLTGRFDLPGPPGPGSLYTSADTKSLWSWQAAAARYEALRRPDPATCLALVFDNDGAITGSTTPDWVPTAIIADVNANPPVNWASIPAPRLGIFSQPSAHTYGYSPWYWYLSSQEQQIFDEQWPPIVDWFTSTIRKFASGNPVHPVILHDVPHYVYVTNETDVVRAMREFLGLPVGSR